MTKHRKSSESYVKLYHGGYVKKSTANWIYKKQADTGKAIMIWMGIALLFALISRCS